MTIIDKPIHLIGRSARVRLGGVEIGFTGEWTFETIDAAIEAAKPGDTVYVLPNGGDEMSYSEALRHARMRCNTMSERQLWTRMGKMTIPLKLRAFAEVADEKGFPDIAAAARARFTRFSGGGVIDQPVRGHVGTRPARKSSLQTDNKGRALRRMDG